MDPKEYYGYTVYPDGTIISKKGHILKPYKHYRYRKTQWTDYCWAVTINKKRHKVHQVLAACFLPPMPTDGWYCIDHIDGNKDNNVVSNLRWCDFRENSSKGNRSLEAYTAMKNAQQLSHE